MKKQSIGLLIACGIMTQAPDIRASNLVAAMVKNYRQSTVYIKVLKTSDKGEVIESSGTGFIVTKKGHIITSCHLVDKIIRDKEGNDTGRKADAVRISGVTGSSRDPGVEPLAFIDCAQGSMDLALLKFTNSGKLRKAVDIAAFSPPTYGDRIGAMGYPLETEFFARDGSFSAEADDDAMLVDMTLNPGDSGAPVFNKKLKVVGVAEAGYSNGARIGVVRPIRYAAVLLNMAGIPLVATNADIPSTSAADGSTDSQVAVGDFKQSIRIFSAATTPPAVDAKEIKITYAYGKRIVGATESGIPAANAEFNITDLPAKPGYKVVGAKLIVTGKKDAEVLHVGPTPDGKSVRTAIKRSVEDGGVDSGKTAYVKGFVETTQVKISN